MASVEEDFPRGGTKKKTTESKIVVQRPDVDNLFQTTNEEATNKRKATNKEHKKFKKQKTDGKKEEELTLNTAAKCVEILHIKNIKEGMLLLGCVKDVTDFEVTVSLPCGLQGFLSIRNICDSYTKLLSDQLDSDDAEELCSLPRVFIPGMVIRCVVAKLDTSKRGSLSIQLSINPKLVNKNLTMTTLKVGMVLSGCVESVEDHGYVIDIGVSGTKAFLPKNAIKGQQNNCEELSTGQYVTYQVAAVKNDGRVVHVSIDPSAISQACADPQQGWNLTNLLPGLLVNATIKKVTKHGLLLDFLSSFSGQVDFLHMEPGQESSYAEGVQVRACVLYVEPSTRLVGLSLRPYLTQTGTLVDPNPAAGDRIGEVVKECKMTAMHHLSGAVLELPDKTLAFVHKNHLKEYNTPANENKVWARPQHTCRIMDFSPMDQIFMVSLRRSVIEKKFFRYHDLQAGQFVEGTVSVLLTNGMVVHLSDHIKGLVPRMHLSDVILKNPEKKYMEGMKVKCRVLSVEPEKKKLFLTRKKALIESTLPLILSYADARPGRVSHGHVVCVKNFGCIVRFYNNVKGLVPVRELSSEPIISPEEVFYPGQVLKTKVLHCHPEKEKMVLSFKATMEGDTDVTKPEFNCDVGEKFEAKVLKKSPSGLEVSILPDEFHAVLPTVHLSDHMSNCTMLWESLQVGDVLSDLVCCSKKQQKISFTNKPTVRWSLEDGMAAKDFSELTVGMQLIGWIMNIMSYGVFVEFPYGLVGLSPKAAMSDKFISDTKLAFQLGQTVLAKVTNLDEEKQRFLVTLRVSEVLYPEGHVQTRLVNGLRERRAVMEKLAAKEGSEPHQALVSLTVGQKLKLTVDSVTDSGATFKSDDMVGATFLATKHHIKDVNLSSGQKVSASVLHMDVISASVHVSVLPKLVEKKKSLCEGQKCTATVQHVDKDFAVISMNNTAQLTVIQTRSHLNEVLLFESDKLKEGGTVSVEVVDPSSEEMQGLPLVSWHQAAAPPRHRTTSETQSGSRGHCFGEVLQGKVKSVQPTRIKVALEDGSTGYVHVSEVMEPEAVNVGSFPTSSVKVGCDVTVRVIGGREASNKKFLPFSHPKFKYTIPELTLIPSKLDKSVAIKGKTASEKLTGHKVGDEITCFVSKFHPDKKSLEVTTDLYKTWTIDLLAMITNPKDASHPEKLYKLGKAVRAKVVEVVVKPPRFVLSLTGVHKLEKGSCSLGLITNVLPQAGLQVRLPFGGTGFVCVTDVADAYKPNPLEAFSKDQLLRFYLLGCKNDKWQLSLRPSRLNPQQAKPAKDPEVLSAEELTVGQTIRGYVKSVGEHGIFIRLSSCITGRARLQQSTKYFVTSAKVISDHLALSSLLTTKVCSIDKGEGLVDLSLLTEDTSKPDILPESLGLPLRLVGDEKKEREAKKSKKRSRPKSKETEKDAPSPKKKKKTKKVKTDDNDSGVEVYFREEEDKDVKTNAEKVPSSSAAPSRLQVAAGFSWDVGLSSLKPASTAKAEDSSDDEEHEEGPKSLKKSRHELEKEKKAAEKALVQREAELMDPNLRPEDAAAFERLLLASPNSSLLWLQFMAHHLQATQIEQARAVAERALKTISFREEQEKLNVWVALLNLENMYGTEESIKKVFDRAVQFCEPVLVYQQLADIYTKSDKSKEAESLYKTMVKRFRQNKAVWISYGTFLLQQGQSDAANSLLQRALKSLPSKESVDVITRFAQLEFRYGDADKGRNMLDKVLTSYPKRTDLWSVFIDLTVKHGTQKDVRALFDRVIHLSVSTKKIKFFFKRYLEYEKKHGDSQSVQAVKEKAMEFVEAKGTEAAE